MIVVLIKFVVSCHVFNVLPHKINFNHNEDLVQFWFPVLWIHKAPFHFFQIQDLFMREVNYMITRYKPTSILGQAQSFLWGRGSTKKKKII